MPNLLTESNPCNALSGYKCLGHENGISCEENYQQILQIAYSNKALTSKLGRNPGTGELQVKYLVLLLNKFKNLKNENFLYLFIKIF